MSSSYDRSIFERSGDDFFLSQRFKHACHKFYGTLKVAFQMLSTNALLSFCPRPLAYVIICIFLFYAAILAIHLTNQLNSEKDQIIEDFDLLDINDSRNRILRKLNRRDLIFIAFMTLNFVLNRVILIEKLGSGFIIFHFAIIISFLLFYILPEARSKVIFILNRKYPYKEPG